MGLLELAEWSSAVACFVLAVTGAGWLVLDKMRERRRATLAARFARGLWRTRDGGRRREEDESTTWVIVAQQKGPDFPNAATVRFVRPDVMQGVRDDFTARHSSRDNASITVPQLLKRAARDREAIRRTRSTERVDRSTGLTEWFFTDEWPTVEIPAVSDAVTDFKSM